MLCKRVQQLLLRSLAWNRCLCSRYEVRVVRKMVCEITFVRDGCSRFAFGFSHLRSAFFYPLPTFVAHFPNWIHPVYLMCLAPCESRRRQHTKKLNVFAIPEVLQQRRRRQLHTNTTTYVCMEEQSEFAAWKFMRKKLQCFPFVDAVDSGDTSNHSCCWVGEYVCVCIAFFRHSPAHLASHISSMDFVHTTRTKCITFCKQNVRARDSFSTSPILSPHLISARNCHRMHLKLPDSWVVIPIMLFECIYSLLLLGISTAAVWVCAFFGCWLLAHIPCVCVTSVGLNFCWTIVSDARFSSLCRHRCGANTRPIFFSFVRSSEHNNIWTKWGDCMSVLKFGRVFKNLSQSNWVTNIANGEKCAFDNALNERQMSPDAMLGDRKNKKGYFPH